MYKRQCEHGHVDHEPERIVGQAAYGHADQDDRPVSYTHLLGCAELIRRLENAESYLFTGGDASIQDVYKRQRPMWKMRSYLSPTMSRSV